MTADAKRPFSGETVEGLLEAMQWRLNGKITEEEFSFLFTEWFENTSSKSNEFQSDSLKQSEFKTLLWTRKVTEKDLDMYNALLLYEFNRRILNSPLGGEKGDGKMPMELCSKKWIQTAEELFFMFDHDGTGILRFNDLLLFMHCCLIGTGCVQPFDDSSPQLTSLVLSFFKDAGLQVIVGSPHDYDARRTTEKSDIFIKRDSSRKKINVSLCESKMKSALVDCDIKSLNLQMFKKVLSAKGLSEILLKSLIAHVRKCSKSCKEIIASSDPQSSIQMAFRNAVGPFPKLWNHAVTVSLGFNLGESSFQNLVSAFLLTEAEQAIPGYFFGCSWYPDQNEAKDEGLIFPVVEKLLERYNIWRDNRSQVPTTLDATNSRTRCPTFQLFYAVLLEYKLLQNQLNAVFADFSLYPSMTTVQAIVSRSCSLLVSKDDSYYKDIKVVEKELLSEVFCRDSVQDSNEILNALLSSTDAEMGSPALPASKPPKQIVPTEEQKIMSTSSPEVLRSDIISAAKWVQVYDAASPSKKVDDLNRVGLASSKAEEMPVDKECIQNPHPIDSDPPNITSPNDSMKILKGEEFLESISVQSAVSTSADSIAQLMAQGQSAGVFAHSLREILRRMSNGASKVPLKSLEEVLKLGYSIASAEEQKQSKRKAIPLSNSLSSTLRQKDSQIPETIGPEKSVGAIGRSSMSGVPGQIPVHHRTKRYFENRK